MATFFTRIILDEIEETKKGLFEGKFIMDVMDFNIFQGFEFVLRINRSRVNYSSYDSIFIYKDGKAVAQKIKSYRIGKTKYTEEQLVILTALKIIFSAHRGNLD